MIDEKELHKGWAQWNRNTLLDWLNEYNNDPVTEISIGGRFRCTSSDVANSVLDFLGGTIDPERGLRYLTIEHYMDENKLEAWPLE